MNHLKKKIIYYYLLITAVLLIVEWYIYRMMWQYCGIWSQKTGIPKSVFSIALGAVVVLLFCVVSYIYYGKVNEMIVKESERQVKERNMLFANISHDLKNPMASVLGYARALEEDAVSDSEKENVYHLIAQKSNQMNDMILKMFQYAKMESDGYGLTLVETDLCKMLRGILVDRFDELEEHQIELDMDLPEQEVIVAVDQSEFPRVINNLINNAINHNEDGIRVLIRVTQMDAQVKITVADSGCEIPEKLREEIFEPFKCSDDSRVLKNGSGLGLAITKRIVNLHQGSILIENDIAGYTKGFVIMLQAITSL